MQLNLRQQELLSCSRGAGARARTAGTTLGGVAAALAGSRGAEQQEAEGKGGLNCSLSRGLVHQGSAVARGGVARGCSPATETAARSTASPTASASLPVHSAGLRSSPAGSSTAADPRPHHTAAGPTATLCSQRRSRGRPVGPGMGARGRRGRRFVHCHGIPRPSRDRPDEGAAPAASWTSEMSPRDQPAADVAAASPPRRRRQRGRPPPCAHVHGETAPLPSEASSTTGRTNSGLIHGDEPATAGRSVTVVVPSARPRRRPPRETPPAAVPRQRRDRHPQRSRVVERAPPPNLGLLLPERCLSRTTRRARLHKLLSRITLVEKRSLFLP